MSGPVTQSRVSPTSQPKAGGTVPTIDPNWQVAPGMTGDSLKLSKSAAPGLNLAIDPQDILDQAVKPTLAQMANAKNEANGVGQFYPVPPVPERSDSPFAIQSLKYADNLDRGRETQLTFEPDPNALVPPIPAPMSVVTNPLTGQPDLTLEEAHVRMSGGPYDLYLKVGGNGSIGIDRVMMNGRNVTDYAKDALLAKFKEDPTLYGSIAAVAAVGVVGAAHEYAKKSGKDINFDVLSTDIYKDDHLAVKTKLKASMPGDGPFIRPAGAELAVEYKDGNLDAFASTQYNLQTKDVEATAGANYRINENFNLSAGAYYRPKASDYEIQHEGISPNKPDYGAFVSVNGVF